MSGDLFLIGQSAVSAYRSALAAIGENVANADTAGYSRREVRLQEVKPGRSSDLVFAETVGFAGVKVGAVQRAWDVYRAADARYSASDAARTSVRERWLTAGETAMDDGPAGVGALLGDFFDSGLSLAANPDDTLGRRAMLMALGQAAGSIRDTAGALKRVSESIGQTAHLEVAALNNDLQSLAKVNNQMLTTPGGTSAMATLEDERDQILDRVSGRLGIDVELDAKGRATVRLANASDKVLVDSNGANGVSLVTAQDGRLSLQLLDEGSLSPLPAMGGSLGGLSDSATVIADRRAELDAIATDFTAALNAWSAAGRKDDGTAGGPVLQASAGAASLTVLVSDPADLAAADTLGNANGNLLALNPLRGADGAETRWMTMVAGHGVLLASAKAETSAAALRRDNSYAALDALSGVDLDREAADLMRYQQAYSAASRLIQVGRDTAQTIIDLL